MTALMVLEDFVQNTVEEFGLENIQSKNENRMEHLFLVLL